MLTMKISATSLIVLFLAVSSAALAKERCCVDAGATGELQLAHYIEKPKPPVRTDRDGSSLAKAIIIKEEMDFVTIREDRILRRMFVARNIKWEVISRTETVQGDFTCKNLRNGTTKVYHTVALKLLRGQGRGTMHFDITDAYVRWCLENREEEIPERYLLDDK